MSRNGSGVYSLPAGNPVVTGTTISSSWANTTLSDIATALTGSVASDGQTAMTGNLQMGNNKVTGLATPTSTGDALSFNNTATVSSLTVTGNASVGGTFTLTGGLTLNGNVTVGDSSSDTLTVNATSTFAAGATFSSTFAANGGVTLGDASGDALTINSSAVSIPNGLTFNSGAVTLSSNPTLSAGTANGVLYLNGSKVATSGGALTFDGTTLTGTASGALAANFNRTASSGPTVKVQVVGNDVGTLGSSTDGQGCFDVAATTSLYLRATGTGGRFIRFDADNSEQMRLTSTGLGIGTSSPTKRLTVANLTDTTTVGNNSVMTIQGGAGGTVNSVAEIGFAFQTFSGTNPLCALGYQLTSNAGAGSGALTFSTRSVTTDTAPTERMRIDSSGNVGIGTTSPNSKLAVSYSDTNYAGGIYVTNTATTGNAWGRIDLKSANATGSFVLAQDPSGIAYVTMAGNYPMTFATNNTERMRIDSSGNLLVGTTSRVNNERLSVKTTGAGVWPIIMLGEDRGAVFRITASSGYAAYFERNNGTYVGDIFLTSSGTTTYNTASDYRLKENIAPMTGALAKVAQLKPCTYTWKSDGSDGEGFIAHEIAQVVPQAVRGEKDAVDKDGKPVYQGIDTSFLVATLTAAIQEQQAIITEQSLALQDLKARIETLENK